MKSLFCLYFFFPQFHGDTENYIELACWKQCAVLDTDKLQPVGGTVQRQVYILLPVV
jgi:hypothetical protein